MKYLRESLSVGVVAFMDSVMDISLPESVREQLITHPLSQDEVDQMSTLYQQEDGTLFDSAGIGYSPEDGDELVLGSSIIPPHYSSRSPVCTRCPHGATAARMFARISRTKQEKNSCGGTITGVISNLPAGLGEPVFDKFHAELGKAMMSIPAVKGFEIGSGFEGAKSMTGATHNDLFSGLEPGGNLATKTNHSGGVLGGVTSGQNVYFRIALKPVSSIGQTQHSVDFEGNPAILELTGRHDPCVLPRAVPIVEAMAAVTTMDFVLRQKMRHP